MANLELIKENIELQRQIGENSNDEILKEEYLIPDTLPDVVKILSADVNKRITNTEVQAGKVLVEADVDYSIIYLADEESGRGINSVVYKGKLSNFIDIVGAEQGMFCNVECELEHINTILINERKINIEAYFRVKCEVCKQETFEFVQSVENKPDVQIIKKPECVEKTLYNNTSKLNGKSDVKVTMDKPQIDKIIKFDCMLHKKDVKLSDDKIQCSCFAKVNILYKADGSREIYNLEDDIFISDEKEIVGVNSAMNHEADFIIDSANYKLIQDDLGEDRIISIDVNVNAGVKVSKVENIEVIDDAYSPQSELDILKEKAEVKIRLGEGTTEAIAKDNIRLDGDNDEPVQVMCAKGEITSIDKEIKNEMVNIDGTLKVNCLYKSSNDEIGFGNKEYDLPFTASIEIPGLKDDMEVVVKGTIENIQSSIEAGTIAVKAILSFNSIASYKDNKEYIKTIEVDEEAEAQKKKASVIIYVVQAGDTIWKLAKKYKTTMCDIAKVNGIDLDDTLEIGTKLIIPGRAKI